MGPGDGEGGGETLILAAIPPPSHLKSHAGAYELSSDFTCFEI